MGMTRKELALAWAGQKDVYWKGRPFKLTDISDSEPAMYRLAPTNGLGVTMWQAASALDAEPPKRPQSHVILVALHMEGDLTREQAHDFVLRHMVTHYRPATDKLRTALGDDRAEVSWWVAEDDRTDGSDCDSAVFCDVGSQPAASALLHKAGLTPRCNLIKK